MEYEQTKAHYQSYQEKYKLPGFDQLCEQFELEKVETQPVCFLRILRKHMMEKIINTLNFCDMLLNPGQAPRMYHAFLKVQTKEDGERIEQLYKAFASISLDCLTLELGYDEAREAAMILRITSVWHEQKDTFAKLMYAIANPKKAEARKEKIYFG